MTDLAQQYRDAFEKMQVEERTRATGSLLAAEEKNPDQIAAGRLAGKVIDMPAPVADLDPEEAQKQARAKQQRDDLDAAPKLKEWAQRYNNALVAHDDTQALSWWERATGFAGGLAQSFGAAIPQTFGMGLQGLDATTQSLEPAGALAPFFGTAGTTPQQQEEFKGYQGEAAKELQRFGKQVEEFGKSIDVPPEDRTLANDIAGAFGQLVGQIALAFGGRSGQITNLALFYGMGVETQRRQQVEQGIDPESPEARRAQALGGLVTLVTERLSLEGLLAKIPGLKSRALNLLLQGGKGALAEGTQEVTENIIQQAITNALADDDRNLFDDLWRQFVVAGSAGGLAGLLVDLIVPGRQHGGAPATSDAAQQGEAEATAATIAAVNENAAGSKLAQRDPESYQAYVDEAVSGSERDTIYAPAEEMVTFLQSKGEDPRQVAESFGLDYGEVVQAARAGARVAIPTSAYAARIANSDYGEWFVENASFTPTGRTLADQANEEAETALRAQADELQQQIEAELELRASDVQVAEAVMQQFTEAGVAPEVARQVSEAAAAFFRTLGAKTGTDALEAFKAVGGIRVKGEVLERLSSLSRDEVDKLIDLARSGRTKSTAKRDDSLIPFLRRQGLQDDGGELKAIGAEKLIKKGGRTLEDAAQAAADAGYLPDLKAELDGERLATLNPRNVLLDAMAKELRGQPVRIPDSAADAADAQAAAVEDLMEAAQQLNIDLGQDNETIKRQLDLEGGGGRRVEERSGGILRGFTQFPVTGVRPDAPATIFLTKDYDLSTLLHEMAHAFFEIELSTLRQNPNAEALQQDIDTLKEWWGGNTKAVAREATAYLKQSAPEAEAVTADEVAAFLATDLTATDERTTAIHTGLHEQFARGFEAYLFEGKAPSVGLQDVFRRFKSWMLLIYKQVRRLGVRLDDKARDAFDRMLATEEEIQDARELAGKAGSIDTPELAYMTEAQQQAYRKRSQEALERSREEVLADLMADLAKTQSKEYEAIRKETATAAEQIVNARPVYRAWEWLANGRWLGDGQPEGIPEIKLSKEVLIELGYAGNLRNPTNRAAGNVILPPIYAAKDGVDPDLIAGFFGFRSGDSMVRAILSSPDRKTAIQEQTDSMMRERVGDMLRDGRLEEEALAAVHGEDFASVIEAEVRALSLDRPGFQPALSKAAAAQAADMASRWTPRQAKPDLYLRAERRAGEQSRRALQKGDRQEALKQKERQLLNHHLWREAKKAEASIDKLLRQVARYRRKAVRQNIGPDYIAQIDRALGTYDFVKRSEKEIRGGESMLAFVQRMEAEGRGNEVDIDPRIIERAQKTNYSRVPVDELVALSDALKNLEHLGRLKTRLLLENEKRELELVVDAVETSIRDSGTYRHVRIGSPDLATQIKQLGQQGANLLFTPDTIMRTLDGGKDFGPVMEHLGRPIHRAVSDKLIPLQEKMAADVEQIFSVYSKKEQRAMSRRREIEGLPDPLSKWQMLSVAFNWGNEDNRLALLEGGQLVESQVDLILRRLDKRDWDFVQSVWDYLDTYWPQIKALQEQRTGTAPEKVPALSVETPFGTYAGGYYPLKYDAGQDTRVGDEADQDITKRMQAGRFSKAQTRRGHTIERKGSGGRPVLLESHVFQSHLKQVAYDLSLGEAVAYVNRVLMHPRTRHAFEQTGRLDTWRTLDLWLKDAAIGDLPVAGIFDSLAHKARTGLSTVALGWSIKTALLQPLGLLQTAVTIGKVHAVKGALKIARGPHHGPRSVWKEIYELSPFMKERMGAFNKDILVARQGANKVFPQWLVDSYFYLISRTQQIVDGATWVGAYSKGQEMFGGNLEKSRDYADAMVKRSQSSPLMTDRSGLERGTVHSRLRQSEIVRALFTTMASYMYAKTNVAAVRFQDTNFRDPRQVANWTVDMILLYVIEGIVIGWMTGQLGGEGDDDEDPLTFVARTTLNTILGGIPVVREIASEVEGFRGGGAFTAVWEFPGKAYVELTDDDGGSLQDFKRINDLGGLIFRYPSKQINRTLDAFIRQIDGEDVSPLEYLMWQKK